MRGGVLKGRALQGEGKFEEAAAAFDNVLKLGAGESGELIDAQKQSATIGKAACLAQTGKATEAVSLLEEVITKADPEQAELHALAYNALGASHRKAGNTKGGAAGLFARRRALQHAGQGPRRSPGEPGTTLERGRQRRSRLESEQVLTERYPSSKWNKK